MSLIDLSITEFTQELASSSPAPGGGSVAALCGALGAALCQMTAGLTLGKKKYEAVSFVMEDLKKTSEILQKKLLAQVNEDTLVYNKVVDAYKLPKTSPAEIDLRTRAIQDALKQAAQTPYETLETSASIFPLVEAAIKMGNPNCITDAGVAAELVLAAVQGAAYNVCVNLMDIHDKVFANDLRKKSMLIQQDIQKRVHEIRKTIEEKIKMEPSS